MTSKEEFNEEDIGKLVLLEAEPDEDGIGNLLGAAFVRIKGRIKELQDEYLILEKIKKPKAIVHSGPTQKRIRSDYEQEGSMYRIPYKSIRKYKKISINFIT